MKQLLVVVFAVPAILVGLLAMHFLTAGGPSESAHTQSMSAVASMPTPVDDCESSCAPSHEMLGMICVLALLAAVVFPVRPIRIRWDYLPRVTANGAARAVSLAPPQPPSLHVLSISRT